MAPPVKLRNQPFDPYRIQDEAVLYEEIYPAWEWWVRHQGSLWRARLLEENSTLQVGSIVYVVKRHGSVLLIQPMSS